MTWLNLLNVALIFLGLWVALLHKQWSFPWWCNMVASATNAAIVMWLLVRA